MTEGRDVATSGHPQRLWLVDLTKFLEEVLVESGMPPSNMTGPSDTEPTHLREDIDKLRAAHYDLREKMIALRETEIVTLKEQVHDFSMKLKLWATIGSVVVALLTGLGLKQYKDLNDLVNKSFAKKLDESFQYQDRLGRALALSNAKDWRSALTVLQDLNEKKPEDEIVFLHLVNAYANLEQYEEGYATIMKAKDQNQFPRFQQRHSFNSTGWVLFVKGLRDEKSLAEAEEMLKRAEKIGRAQSDPAINTIYGNLCLYYLVRGDLDRAQINLQRLADISSKELSKFRMELKTERESEWAKRIRQKRPSYEKDLETLFENVKGS